MKMAKKILSLLKNNPSFNYLFAWSLLYFILGLIYLIKDGLSVYDAPGHVNLVWYLKEYLWPSFSGWNPFTLLGIEQGTTYPFLFHYLSASLAFLLGVDLSIKIIILIFLTLIPISTYYFASRLLDKEVERLVLVSVLSFLLLFLPGYLGSDLKALTQVGLIPSLVSLPLIFFYLGSLDHLKKGKILLPTLLLSAVVLTHLVAGLFVCAFITCLLFLSLFTKESTKYFLLHVFFSLLLTSFFWIPFLLNYSSFSQSAHLPSLGWPNLIVLLISVGLLGFFFKKKNYFLATFSLLANLISLVILFDNRLAGELFYSLHLYRYQIYLYIITTVLVVVFLLERINKKRSLWLLVAGLFLISLGGLLFRSAFLTPTSTEIKALSSGGRFLEAFSRVQTYPTIYTVQTNLIREQNLHWAYGLFTDTTANGPYLSSLIRSLNPDNYAQSPSALIEEQTLDNEKLDQALNLLGVSSLLSLENGVSSRTITHLGEEKNLALSPQNSTSLVEPLELKPRFIKENFKKEVEKWWVEKGEFKDILVNATSGDFGVADSQAKATFVEHNPNWTKFVINIDAKEKTPILIKFGYNPNWQARDELGRIVKIYQVAPSLMLVNGQGEVRFEYKKPSWGRFLVLFSFLGLAYLIISERKVKP